MTLAKATLTKLDARGNPIPGEAIEAQFNPQNLQITYQTSGAVSSTRTSHGAGTGAVTGSSNQRTGFTTSLSSVQLIFDTTETGEDVRQTTLRIARLVQEPDQNQVPRVQFQWGTFLFQGTIDSLSETLEYFSEAGVPLRATVTFSMSMNERELATPAAGSGSGAGAAGASAGLSAGFGAGLSAGLSAGFSAQAGFGAGVSVGVTPLTLSQSGETLQSLSARAGVSWKAVAAANGIDNPRQLQAGTVLNLKAGASASARVGS